jgi:hypothetical protein
MFLRNLSENEKKAFLTLADRVLKVDNVIAEEELELLRGFAQEMELSDIKCNLPEDEAYNIFGEVENKVKRAVYTELLSLAFVDNTFDEKEMNCLKNIQEKLGLPDDFVKRVQDWLDSYMEKTKEGFRLIEGGI